jgi:hypothetical protein
LSSVIIRSVDAPSVEVMSDWELSTVRKALGTFHRSSGAIDLVRSSCNAACRRKRKFQLLAEALDIR